MEQLTYNPVLESEALARFRVLKPLRQPQPGTAMVLVPKDGEAVTVHNGEPISDAWIGRYQHRYLVDISEHRLALDVTLLSRDPNFGFRAKVSLICRVGDPVQIVARGIQDISHALYDPIKRMLREVARDYDVHQFHEAENALNVSMEGFAGDRAIRLRNIRVELLVDDEEVATSGREFRDLSRETRLEGMRRRRHLDMMREEGIEGLLAGIVEREGPRAALEWIATAEEKERAELGAALETVFKHTGADMEPWAVEEAVRPLIDRVSTRSGVPFSGSRVRGAITSGSGRDPEPRRERPVDPDPPKPTVVPEASTPEPLLARESRPPEDEPSGGPATTRLKSTPDSTAERNGDGKRMSRVRGVRP
jgi:hypothetical protein